MKLLLISEGTRDIGDASSGVVGAVRVIVTRLLEAHWGRSISQSEIDTVPLPRAHGSGRPASGYPRKVRLAILQAELAGRSSLAIVVDRDRTTGNERLNSLREGRDILSATKPISQHTAIGVAVQTVEAWLLADEKALSDALGVRVQKLQDPETLDGLRHTTQHPKDIFEQLIKRATTHHASYYDAVANAIDLSILRSRCSVGFARFADEIVSRIR